MVAEPNPTNLEYDLDSRDDELTRSIERVSAASGRLVLRRAGVPVAIVVPVSGEKDLVPHRPDWERMRAVLGEASARFTDVPMEELEAAIAAAADEAGDETWRERRSAGR